jgi:hypothetical protein
MLRTGFTLSQNVDLACKFWELGDTAPCFCDTTFGVRANCSQTVLEFMRKFGASDLSKVADIAIH